jgi:hypothetical protein
MALLLGSDCLLLGVKKLALEFDPFLSLLVKDVLEVLKLFSFILSLGFFFKYELLDLMFHL